MRAWLRHPLLHFLALGGALFALAGGAERARLASAPPEEIGDEELLLREARALGLHESDALVRRRLIRNMRFADGDPQRSDEELFREALALGMDESDVVVRRRLVQRLVLAVQAAARAYEPTEAELAALLARDRERFERPARVRLSQVFLSRQRRGAGLAGDARRLREELAAAGLGPAAADAHGDALPLPAHLPLHSQAELAASFGAGFAREVFALPMGAWSGPVASSYGLHLVWIREREPAGLPGARVLRSELREAFLEERAEAALRERLAWLRAAS